MILRHDPAVFTLSLVLGFLSITVQASEANSGRVFYVRQTIGNDTNDGLSPQTAWRSLSRLGSDVHAGDVAYVGPGLYREMVTVANSGTPDAMIQFIADTTGQHTGDPPGTVMITGADTMNETAFVPQPSPGVFMAPGLKRQLLQVVEMDAAKYLYRIATDTPEYIRENLPALEVVARMPSTFHHNRESGKLYIHTSDGRAPSSHEIELIRRSYGFLILEKHYVSVTGFTFRHMGTAGIGFGQGSGHGLALNNTSYGSWQGIRISESNHVRVEGNTVFRNGNSGIYFLSGSTQGHASRNIAYENAIGVRWSSGSVNGVALENLVFENREAGIAIEDTDNIRVSNNLIANNGITQLLLRKSEYTLMTNCYGSGGTEQLIATTGFREHFETLDDFQQATGQDLDASENCSPLPQEIDVNRLHIETRIYAERARKILSAQVE